MLKMSSNTDLLEAAHCDFKRINRLKHPLKEKRQIEFESLDVGDTTH